jgi:hypothetical protein
MAVSADTRKLEEQITKLQVRITDLTIECGGLKKAKDDLQCQYSTTYRDWALEKARGETWEAAFRTLASSLREKT